MKIRLLLLMVGGLVAAVVIFLLSNIGVPVEFALAWILLAAALALVTRQVFFDDSVTWPPDERPRTIRGSEVSRLAWSMNPRTGEAGHVLVRRVERVVRRLLAHRGLDLDDVEQHARIDALLGAGIREILGSRGARRTDIERVLDAIERLPTRAEAARHTEFPTRTEES